MKVHFNIKFIRVNLLVVIAVFCSCIVIKESISYRSPEEQALLFFVDSLLYKDFTFVPFEDIPETGSFILAPPDYNRGLVVNGLFSGKEVYSSGAIEKISSPYIDTLDLYANREYLEDSVLKKIITFNQDWKDKTSESFQPTLMNLPAMVRQTTWTEFNTFTSDNILFLEVGSHLESGDDYLVEILLHDKGKFNTYEFYIFLNKELIVTSWQAA